MASVILPRLLDVISSNTSTDRSAPAGTKLQRRQTRLAWVLLVPSLAVVALVALYPLGKTVYQSFTNEEFLALTPTEWVGLQNWDLWHDTLFRDSIWITIKFTVITVSIEFALGLMIALVVNSSFKVAASCARSCSYRGRFRLSSRRRCGSGCSTTRSVSSTTSASV